MPDFQKIFQSVPGLYLILKPDFTIVAASDAYLRATKTKREAILGRGIFQVFPDNPNDPNADGVQNLSASLRRVLKTRAPDTMAVQKYDIPRPEEEGGGFEERFWSPVNTPVLGARDEVIYIIHRVEDVTEFMRLQQAHIEQGKEAEQWRAKAALMEREMFNRSKELEVANEKLRASISELEAFSYSLSHDMRAPLRAILSFSQIVLTDSSDKLDGESIEYLQKVADSARRMDRLINDVLSFTRLSRQEIFLEQVNVEKLIRDIISERPELQEPNTEITIQSPLLPMLGHDASLTQCISNLLHNAVKFVDDGVKPQVRIYSEGVGDEVRLWFKDNGIGIDKEGQRRLFALFQRVQGDSNNGTGIGLAIVRKAVERMNGKVGVVSDPGGGSRFWVQLKRGEP